MREQEFARWLATEYKTSGGTTMDPAAHASRLSNCRRIEQHLGDLDAAFAKDGMESLVGLLTFSSSDSSPRHGIPIDGNQYTGTATLRSAARLYQKFREATSTQPVLSKEQLEIDREMRQAVPDDSQREALAHVMTRLIERAAARTPAAWVLVRRAKMGLFLNVTFYRVFGISRDGIWIAFTKSEASNRLNTLVEGDPSEPETETFKSLGDNVAANVSVDDFLENLTEFEPLLEAFLDRVTTRYNTTSYSRHHSSAAVEWLEARVARSLPRPTYEVSGAQATRASEVAELVGEFVRTWATQPEGRAHFAGYAHERATAQEQLAGIRGAAAQGNDITEMVLRGVLPHVDTEQNRARGAWIHRASAVAGDVKSKLNTVPRDWPAVAGAIMNFIDEALDDPDDLQPACDAFDASPHSRSFQSGILTPFLNSVDPDHFAIVNGKSRPVTSYFLTRKLSQKIVDYPASNAAVFEAAGELLVLVDAIELLDIRPIDLYDAFCHWAVSIRDLFGETDPDAPLFTERAFELLETLEADPTVETYQTIKDELKERIERPCRQLLASTVERLTPEMQAGLETSKNLFSRFRKNDYGRGGVWPFYWGALYPKGTSRVEGVQLYLAAHGSAFRYGFFVADPMSVAGRRVLDAMRSGAVSASLHSKFELWSSETGIAHSLDDFASDADRVTLRRELSVPDVMELTFDELAQQVADGFIELYQLVKIAQGETVTKGSGPATAPDAEPASAKQPVEPQHSVTNNDSYALEDLSAETGFAESDIRSWIRAIERKKQAILYGPPGTGKTFAAERLARHLLSGSDGFHEVIQFHPAYSYEDFVEGIRPRTDGTVISYPIVPGRFRDFCDRARSRSGLCILIIDEINRANLARVLGELMYLLEYRDKAVPLASGTIFSIPPNVRIIGTMNTADRSIALVDHALRRRFAFIALEPDFDVLRRFHGSSPLVDSLIQLLGDINGSIDPHYRLGISFFMRKNLPQDLPDIWRTEIEPYLEEYFVDRRDSWEASRWDKVASRLGLASGRTAVAEPDDDDFAESPSS